ncbi:MAG TPA: glycoside hydrolase family 15 protein [Acidimicrobiia bacterium]|nr:glycoside hydrolase family 15 protein [Acidimicrobiia bacterium]
MSIGRDPRWPSIDVLRLLSDGRSAALLDANATVQWWCWPRFHSPPLCWRLLDRRGGAASWLEATHVAASGEPAGSTTRTTLRIGFGGRIEVWDGLLDAPDGGSDLVRLVRALDGPLDVWHAVKLGGFDREWVRWSGDEARFDDESSLFLAGGTTTHGADGTATTRLRLVDDRWNALVLGHAASADEIDVAALVQQLESSEREDQFDPPRVSKTHSERVRHTLTLLSSCTDRDTGAVVASPTTSLPEVVGGNRQFDYRYSWLRDSSVAITAAMLVGKPDLARRYVDFLLSLGAEGILESPVRRVDGGLVPRERSVDGVEGWFASTPVRVGNDAATQLQYDVLGFVLDAIWIYRRHARRPDPMLWTVARALADRAAESPNEASNGVWEVREPQRFVSGDIGRWLALDRALRLGHRFSAARTRARWRRARDEVRVRVLGALPADGTLPQVYGAGGVDASALLLVVFRLLPPRDPRAARIVDATIDALGAGPLLYRYPPDGRDSFDPGEAPFVPASWWAVTALAVLQRPEAQRRADELCALLPALQAEGFDPARREALGNTPLLWSHAECTRALFELDRQKRWRHRIVAASSRRIMGWRR